MYAKRICVLLIATLMATAFVAVAVYAATVRLGHIRNADYINAADATMLRRYLANTNNPPAGFHRDNADLNADGNVDQQDLAMLRAYIAGEDVTFGAQGRMRRYLTLDDFPPGTRFVALTFDDGPNNRYTAQILDRLEYHGATATFYVNPLKFNNNTLWHPSGPGTHANTIPIIQRMIAQGHDVSNHGWDHRSFGGAQNYMGPPITTVVDARANLRQAHQAIFDVTGYWPFCFRAPFFEWGNMLRHFDWEFNMAFIDSAIDPADFLAQSPGGAQSIANTILARSRENVRTGLNGGNILLHDCGGGRQQTVNSLDIFIPALQAEGFEFVSVRQLYYLTGATPERFGYIGHPDSSFNWVGGNMWPRVNQHIPMHRGAWEQGTPLWQPGWHSLMGSDNCPWTDPTPPWERTGAAIRPARP